MYGFGNFEEKSVTRRRIFQNFITRGRFFNFVGTVNVFKVEYMAGRLAGIGEIATQYSGIAPNDPALEPYFALAEELDLPVLIHVYNPNFGDARGGITWQLFIAIIIQ